MHRRVVTQDLGKGAKSLVLLLVDLGRVRNEGQNVRFGQFVRKDLEAALIADLDVRVAASLR